MLGPFWSRSVCFRPQIGAAQLVCKNLTAWVQRSVDWESPGNKRNELLCKPGFICLVLCKLSCKLRLQTLVYGVHFTNFFSKRKCLGRERTHNIWWAHVTVSIQQVKTATGVVRLLSLPVCSCNQDLSLHVVPCFDILCCMVVFCFRLWHFSSWLNITFAA